MGIIAEKVKAFVEDYASASLSKDEFKERYATLENKYNETYEKYQKLLKLKSSLPKSALTYIYLVYIRFL